MVRRREGVAAVARERAGVRASGGHGERPRRHHRPVRLPRAPVPALLPVDGDSKRGSSSGRPPLPPLAPLTAARALCSIAGGDERVWALQHWPPCLHVLSSYVVDLGGVGGRDGTGRDGMGWDEDGMGWDGMGWDGMGWDEDGVGWDGMGWDGMGWDGVA
ncbi:unnamed protein product [Closterium sp. NIES-53]